LGTTKFEKDSEFPKNLVMVPQSRVKNQGLRGVFCDYRPEF